MKETPSTWNFVGAWSGGTVSAVALSPRFEADGVALAATAAGLFRSADGGDTWQLSSDGMDDPVVFALTCAALDESNWVALASTGTGRLYRSENGGQAWQEVEAWAGLGVITALLLSPAYADDRSIFTGTTDGMFRSQDGGASWESSTFGLLDTEILCIAAAPDYAESETLWIGSALGGFYRSRNGARSWRESGVGLPDSAVQCVAVSPEYAADRTLWVGMEEGGIYRSTDGGQSWQPAKTNPADVSINKLLLVASVGSTLLAGTDAGLYGSRNGGVDWTPVESGAFVALDLAQAGETLLATSFAEGIFQSVSGRESLGAQWTEANNGLIAHAPPLVQASADGALVALDLDGTLAKSTDDGRTWSASVLDPVGAFAVTAAGETLALSDGVLFVGHVDQPAQQWSSLPTPVEEPHILALSPGFADDEMVLIGGAQGTVYLSDDSGESWEVLESPLPGAALIHAAFAPADFYADGETILAVSLLSAPGGNFSVDVSIAPLDSLEWENLIRFETEIAAVLLTVPGEPETGLLVFATQHRVIRLFVDDEDDLAVEQFFFDEGVRISSLAASPGYAQDRTLYVGTNEGAYRSTDGGTSWDPLGAAWDQPVVAVLPDGKGNVTVVTLGGSVWLYSLQ